MFDWFWVAGERQTAFAAKVGFTGPRLMRGHLTCDRELFDAVAMQRFAAGRSVESWPRRFTYIGRFLSWKGLADLLAAYRQYREHTAGDPWELWCVGGGPLRGMLEGEPGVHVAGFAQPNELAQMLAESGVFVLPSHYEPWGLVIHEATSAGLPVLCSTVCGAHPELVQDGYNGFLFEPGDIGYLARLMEYCASGSVDLAEFGRRSARLADRLSPERWADYLAAMLALRAGVHLRPRRRVSPQMPDLAQDDPETGTPPIRRRHQVHGPDWEQTGEEAIRRG
jgi:hypothetical protein